MTPLTLRKSDILLQVYLDLDYAAKITGPGAAAAIKLAMLLASSLSPEERQQIAATNELFRTNNIHG